MASQFITSFYFLILWAPLGLFTKDFIFFRPLWQWHFKTNKFRKKIQIQMMMYTAKNKPSQTFCSCWEDILILFFLFFYLIFANQFGFASLYFIIIFQVFWVCVRHIYVQLFKKAKNISKLVKIVASWNRTWTGRIFFPFETDCTFFALSFF